MTGNEIGTSPLEVVVVEDESTFVDLIRRGLRKAGVHSDVLCFASGEEALPVLLAQGQRDGKRNRVLFLDLHLPGIDGLEVIEAIRHAKSSATLPIIVISNASERETINRAYRAGANCYIVKPTTLAEWDQLFCGFEQFWLRYVRLPGT